MRATQRPFIAFILSIALLASAGLALEQRTFSETFDFDGDRRLRIANLAGSLTIEQSSSGRVEVEVSAYAEGRNRAETDRMLSEMSFVKHRNKDGKMEWTLSYPVDRYDTIHYPSSEERHQDKEPGFWEKLADGMSWGHSNTTYLGERVRISRSDGTPTLYADMIVRVPDSGPVSVRNVIGPVSAGRLAGDLVIDTGSGEVDLAEFDGKLLIDTGSGKVSVGRVNGDTVIDTGSGGIEVQELIGLGNLDTGSGSVKVFRVAADWLRVDTGSGSVLVQDGSVRELIADTGSGGIKVLNVEVEIFEGDTGSGGVTLESSLLNAELVNIDTGSGSVKIFADAGAQFDVIADQGSGNFTCGYDDAELIKDGREVIGARRGNRQTRIRVDTGSGSVTIAPR